jgi:peptide deformylase
MAVLPIYVVPQAVLKKSADTVTEITPEIRKLADDMVETMYAARGIGLAAPQVGVSKRVIVLDVDQRRGDGTPHAEESDDADDDHDDAPPVPGKPQVFINPEVVWEAEELNVYEEGCLSIPGLYAPVERPEKVRVRYMSLDGATQEIEADGLLATCLQHEIDHINGILFIDHLSSLKRDMILRKLKKHLRENAEDFVDTHVL